MNQETFMQQQIVNLRTRLLVMCASVGLALDDAVLALENMDAARASAVIDGDSDIDALENEIDDKSLRILARAQPVAGDLRFVVSAVRMVLDLERIGDEATTLAEGGILLRELPRYTIMEDVLDFLYQCRNAYERAVSIFRNGNIDAAYEFFRSADEAMQAEVRVLQKCMHHFTEKLVDEQGFMHIILIIRSGTRIWRRSTNIAEHVYFTRQGESLKHLRE